MKPLAIVVAMAKNRVIGKDGGLPWRIPEDLRHFKQITMGHAIIMGRKTYESIGRPLQGRRNIVLSHDPRLRIEGCEVVHDLDTAIDLAREHDEEPRIIGGGTLYALALPRTTRIYLTEVDTEAEGDTVFPEIDGNDWTERQRQPRTGFDFIVLERRPAPLGGNLEGARR